MSDGARILAVKVSSLSRDMGGRLWNPSIRWTVKHAVFVELNLDDGSSGLGECWCFDTAPDALISFLRTEIAPALLDQAVTSARAAMRAQWRRATLTARHGMLASAHSGVDLALWDASARARRLPLWQAINAAGSGDCFTYGSGGLYGLGKGPDAIADELENFARQGFQAVKMKVGALSPDEDAARVRAVRDRIGPSVRLIIDAVASLDTDAALGFFDRVRDLGIEAFQAPIPPADLDGMRRLVREGVPVMAGEAEYREEILADLIGTGAVATLQVAPIACGGPSRVVDLARHCSEAGIPMSLETSSTAVAALAALHLGAALPAVAHVEIHQVHDVLFDAAGIPYPIDGNGRMAPPGPGLGFTLPQGSVARGFEATTTIDRETVAATPTIGLI